MIVMMSTSTVITNHPQFLTPFGIANLLCLIVRSLSLIFIIIVVVVVVVIIIIIIIIAIIIMIILFIPFTIYLFIFIVYLFTLVIYLYIYLFFDMWTYSPIREPILNPRMLRVEGIS